MVLVVGDLPGCWVLGAGCEVGEVRRLRRTTLRGTAASSGGVPGEGLEGDQRQGGSGAEAGQRQASQVPPVGSVRRRRDDRIRRMVAAPPSFATMSVSVLLTSSLRLFIEVTCFSRCMYLVSVCFLYFLCVLRWFSAGSAL